MSARPTANSLGAVRRFAPTVALGVGGALLAAGFGAVTLYTVPGLQLVHPYAVMASAFIPYGIVAFAGAAALFAASGRHWARPIAVAAVAGMLLQGWWAKPYWPAAAPEPGASSFTLVTMNMRCDSRGIADLAALTQRVQPDVVVVQGLNAAKRSALGEAWGRQLPYSTFHPMAHLTTCGTFVFSRTPLRQLSAPGDAQPVVEIDRPDGPLVLLPVDLPGPRHCRW